MQRSFSSVRSLGATSLRLGPFGLGVAPLGNLYAPVSDEDAQATLAAAVRHGIGWMDVAPLYGLGLAEERLGQFLRRTSATPLISTKVGRILEPVAAAARHDQFVAPLANHPRFDYTRAGIERSYEESLRRLGLDRVEILLLHDVDRRNHPEGHRELVRQLLDESLPALQRLKTEGRVDAIGLGVCEWDIASEILSSAPIDCILLAGRYTLLDQTALTSGFLDTCANTGVSVLAGGALNSGFLAGGSRYDYQPADPALIARRDRLLALAGRHGVSIAAAAVQFTAAHPAITSTVVGARSREEVDALLEWSRLDIPSPFWDELRADGFIPSHAPTPDRSY